jgi:hypothetical protein
MKSKLYFKTLFQNLLIVVFALVTSSASIAQEKKLSKLKDFKFSIENSKNGIKIISLLGSAWTELNFSIKNEKTQAIDEYGMTNLDKVSPMKDSKLADYLFVVTKTKKGILLKGLEGTTWAELSFSLPKSGKQVIDQFGMKK